MSWMRSWTTCLRAIHSPVERCAETARGIAQGADAVGVAAIVVGHDPGLGDPFLRDRQRALALAEELGPRFLRHWFEGRVAASVLQEHQEAAAQQLAVWAHHVETTEIDSAVILVSHDWNLALVREVVLGIRHEDAWPHFLEGVVIAVDGDDIVVGSCGRTGRVRRATLPRKATADIAAG
jgi:hypothetical protein